MESQSPLPVANPEESIFTRSVGATACVPPCPNCVLFMPVLRLASVAVTFDDRVTLCDLGRKST
jgi:hypothetical protein